MKKILILFAHPAFQRSRINKLLIKGLKDMEGITFRDLYQVYPEMDIEINVEQELVEAHDILIFHHPLYWYSTPAILKEWQDLVLTHGWAYGSQGKVLKDKLFLQVLTTGAGQEAYSKKGHNRFTIRQLLVPLEQTAYICQMKYLPPYVVHGTYTITKEDLIKQKEEYINLLEGLRDEKIQLKNLVNMQYFNEYFSNKQRV